MQSKRFIQAENLLTSLHSQLKSRHRLVEIIKTDKQWILQYQIQLLPNRPSLVYIKLELARQCKVNFICKINDNITCQQKILHEVSKQNDLHHFNSLKVCYIMEKAQIQGRFSFLLYSGEDQSQSYSAQQQAELILMKLIHFQRFIQVKILNTIEAEQIESKKKVKSIIFMHKLINFIEEKIQKRTGDKTFSQNEMQKSKPKKKSITEDASFNKFIKDSVKRLFSDLLNQKSMRILRKIKINTFKYSNVDWAPSEHSFGSISKLYAQFQISNGSLHKDTNDVDAFVAFEAFTKCEGYLVEKTALGNLNSVRVLKNQLGILSHIRQKECQFIGDYFIKQVESQSYKNDQLYSVFYPNQSTKLIEMDLRGVKKLAFLSGLSTSLGFLSFNELIHRDLKPHNIMLDSKNTPKLIDFGSATHKKPLSVKFNVHSELKTTLKYNFNYKTIPEYIRKQMSKEQFEFHENFDMYAFGKIMEELVMGQKFSSQIGKYYYEFILWIYHRCTDINPNARIHPEELAIFLKLILKSFTETMNEPKKTNGQDIKEALFPSSIASSFEFE